MTTTSLRAQRSARAKAQWEAERANREAGMEWARKWRERNKPLFDRWFGTEPEESRR